MRPVAALLLALVLHAPAALADHDVSAGPASAQTQNAYAGGGCEGANGAESRQAHGEVRLTANESLVVYYHQSCWAWEQTWDDGQGNNVTQRGAGESGAVGAGRSSRGNHGPYAQFSYTSMREEGPWGAWEHCGSNVYASGPVLFLGCYPDGGRWPMAPTLP